MKIDTVTYSIIEEAIYIHKQVGPGLLESVYEEVLYHRLLKKGYFVERQKPVPLCFEGIKMEIGFRADLVVENLVIVELKSQEVIHPVSYKKLLTYLRLADREVGLLINFYEVMLKKGVRRIVNNYKG